MKFRLSALTLVLCLAFPTLARVLSYSPYTNQVATPGFHLRNTRHFILLENPPGAGGGFWSLNVSRDLVLYDSEGGEPRVITPAGDGVIAAALYQPTRNATPMILASIMAQGQPRTLISADAGTTWKEVTALRNKYIVVRDVTVDTGGPWVQGLNPAIRTSNSGTPFIVNATGHGIYAIAPDGDARIVTPHSFASVHGQNRNGTKLLIIRRSGAPTTFVHMHVFDVETGASTLIASDFVADAHYAGWIADDGTTYIVATRYDGRFLYRWTGGNVENVAGMRDVIAPLYNQTPAVQRDPMDFIAVPTADFNGAWMSQRGGTQPTRLLRYTPATGLLVEWADPSQPEIEALIAGESGQSVLIQVHRDRSLVEQVPFVDPALAIWRIGEMMPREYDELYLNEEENKGFVHVDVDRMREGARFVFNSGSFEQTNEGPISPPIGGGGDVIQEWGVVQSSLKQHLILPGVARLQGGFGSEWRTDVTMYNPIDEAQAIEIDYVPMYEAASAARTITVTLQPREIRFVGDALQSLFLLQNGGGALHFRPAVGMNVVGRTYSTKNGGSYGFGMTAIDAFNAAGPRFPMTFAGAFPGENFRTNVLLTDTSGNGTAAMLSAFGVTGAIGNNGSEVSAPSRGTSQINGIHHTLSLLGRDAGGLVIQPTRGTAIATVVAIDNRTNDPTYFPPDLPTRNIRTIPVIGHLAGANGSQFRSDLYLFNPSTESATVVLEVKRWNSPIVVTRQFTLLPREARVIPDALQTLWNMQGVARLRYWSVDAPDGVRVTSRTYTIEADGSTYGSLIPPLNNFQMAAPGDALEILGATGGAGFRTNVGIVELSAANANGQQSTVRIRLFDEQMRQVDSFTLAIPRASGVQINDIYASRGIATPVAGLIVVEALDEGLIGAYGTMTDNITNDTTYFGAQLGAK